MLIILPKHKLSKSINKKTKPSTIYSTKPIKIANKQIFALISRFAGTEVVVAMRAAVPGLLVLVRAVRNQTQAAGKSEQTAENAAPLPGVLPRFHGNLKNVLYFCIF